MNNPHINSSNCNRAKDDSGQIIVENHFWLGGRKGIRPVKTEWWDDHAAMVLCLGQGADLHMVQLMPLPLPISCSSKSRLVLPF